MSKFTDKTLYNFYIWLKRIGRKDGYKDYIVTYSWTEKDELCFTALLALAED